MVGRGGLSIVHSVVCVNEVQVECGVLHEKRDVLGEEKKGVEEVG